MKFIKAFSITFVSQIVIIISGIVNNIIVVRTLGPEGQGIYTLIITTSVMLLIFGGAGLGVSNIYWARKDRTEASTIFINSLFFAVSISIALWLCYNLFLKKILIMFFMPEIALILIIALPLLLIQEFNQGILWGLERYDYHNFLILFRAIILVIANIILLLTLRLDVKAAVFGWLIVIVLTSIISVYLLWQEIGFTNMFPRPRLSVFFKSLQIGIKALISNIFWFLSTRVDLYIIAYFLGAKEVGLYSIAVLIMQMAGIIPNILSKFILNNSIVSDKRQALFSAGLIKISLVYSFVAALFILLLGEVTIQFFFGKLFINSFKCLIFLLPAIIAQSLHNGIGHFIAGRKEFPVYNVLMIIIILLLNVYFNFLLIPRFGINGAAISSSLSQLIQLILTLLLLSKLKLQLPFAESGVLRLREIVKLFEK